MSSELWVFSAKLLAFSGNDEAVLVDIRFPEERQAWSMGFGLAIIAMTYLRTQGFEARYLTDGLPELACALRDDDVRFFLELLSEID